MRTANAVHWLFRRIAGRCWPRLKVQAESDRDCLSLRGRRTSVRPQFQRGRWPSMRVAGPGESAGSPATRSWTVRMAVIREAARSGPWACGRSRCSSWARWRCASGFDRRDGHRRRQDPHRRPGRLRCGRWAGRPVHVITVNDYLVQPRRRGNGPDLRACSACGPALSSMRRRPQERIDHYRRGIVYCHEQGTGRRLPARPDPAWKPSQPAPRTSLGRLIHESGNGQQQKLHGSGPVPRDSRRGRQPADRRGCDAADHFSNSPRRRRAQRHVLPRFR